VVEWAEREWSGGSITPDTLWAEWGQKLDELLESPGAELCEGAGAFVARLAAAGIPMAINTSSKRVAVAHKRKRHEDTLFKHMRCVVTGDDISKGKPEPDSFLEAANRMCRSPGVWGVSPRKCVAFEDSLPGVQSAVAAGMRVYAIPDRRLNDSELEEFRRISHRVLESLSDLEPDDEFWSLFKK
jgi:HAD superfamily hydrolase (TIGR01509 family)